MNMWKGWGAEKVMKGLQSHVPDETSSWSLPGYVHVVLPCVVPQLTHGCCCI